MGVPRVSDGFLGVPLVILAVLALASGQGLPAATSRHGGAGTVGAGCPPQKRGTPCPDSARLGPPPGDIGTLETAGQLSLGGDFRCPEADVK